MSVRELLRDLYRHMEWADSRVWAAVSTVGPADDRLRDTLVHIHVVQRAFLHVWTKRPVTEAFRQPGEFATLLGVRAWARSYYPEAHAFVGALTDEALAEPVEMPWAAQLTERMGRAPSPTTLVDTCLQIPSHTTHHRGQVNSRLRALDIEPPLVDYIAWGWFGKPVPEWS